MRIFGLEAGYGGDLVLRGVDFSPAPGALTVLVGANGSGKSTLLRVMAGLLLPRAGEVRFGEQSLYALHRKARARLVGYFPQTRPIPDMTARTLIAHGRYPQLRFAGALSARDVAHVARAAALTRTEELLDKNVNELSGGQRQRVYLAMLLTQDTEILLLDEPTAFLDIRAQMDVLEIVAKLRREGRTVVAALHDLQQAFSFADRVALLEEGRIAFEGPPDRPAAAAGVRRALGVSVRLGDPGALFRYTLARDGGAVDAGNGAPENEPLAAPQAEY
ncbi:MAG: ABC transporter ATP-binding protein [Clostridiales Family XIII bacterium]|jgi:iron complex transport system ATP-binding protein|nr:ABC transporter ATP-binding protein [Clostridiales Family XIII bacterium]